MLQFCAKRNKCNAKRIEGTLKQCKTQSSSKHNTRKICNQSTCKTIILSEGMFQWVDNCVTLVWSNTLQNM
jgi:hypothetical protein